MTRLRRGALPLLVAGLLTIPLGAGAEPAGTESSWHSGMRMAMGTLWTVEARGPRAEQLVDRGFAEVRRLDALLSTYKADSELSALNRGAGGTAVRLSAETWDLLRRARDHAARSDGAFDPTVGSLMKAWGFKGMDYRLPDRASLEAARARVGYRLLVLEPDHRARLSRAGVEVDLGAIAKGYAVDRALEVMRSGGALSGRVDAGGNQGVFGQPPSGEAWQFGIRHPARADTVLGTLHLASGGISTSGDAERGFWKDGVRYGHIVDPRTGWPARGCLSVTVVGPTAEVADALSTTLYVQGPTLGKHHLEAYSGYSALWVLPGADALSWRVERSAGFPAVRGLGSEGGGT